MRTFSDPPGARIPGWPYVLALIALTITTLPAIPGRDTTSHPIPRAQAMGDSTFLTWTHSVSDLTSAIAYAAITITLIYIALSLRASLPFTGVILAFSVFIFCCSLTHLVNFITLYWPMYHLSTGIKTLTAVVATGTAIAIPPLVPQLRRILTSARDAEDGKAAQEKKIAEATRTQRQLTRQVVVAEQEERKDIGTKIHDGLTQTATAALHNWETDTRDLFDDLAAVLAGKLRWTKELFDKHTQKAQRNLGRSRQVVEESREVIDDLRPQALDRFGLETAIRDKVLQLNKEGWNVHFHVDHTENGYLGDVQRDQEHALYRVLQEALENIKKHAAATRTDITLKLIGTGHDSARAELLITDNGRGFDPEAIQPQSEGPGKQIGLESRKEILKQLGGHLVIHSSPGSGTTLHAQIPLGEENQEAQYGPPADREATQSSDS